MCVSLADGPPGRPLVRAGPPPDARRRDRVARRLRLDGPDAKRRDHRDRGTHPVRRRGDPVRTAPSSSAAASAGPSAAPAATPTPHDGPIGTTGSVVVLGNDGSLVPRRRGGDLDRPGDGFGRGVHVPRLVTRRVAYRGRTQRRPDRRHPRVRRGGCRQGRPRTAGGRPPELDDRPVLPLVAARRQGGVLPRHRSRWPRPAGRAGRRQRRDRRQRPGVGHPAREPVLLRLDRFGRAAGPCRHGHRGVPGRDRAGRQTEATPSRSPATSAPRS